MTQKVACIVDGEQIFACGERDRAALGKLTMQIIVERIYRLLDPGERKPGKRVCIFDGLIEREGAVAVDGKRHAGLQESEHGLDAHQVVDKRLSANLNLEL